jgi:iron-sulfur cluster insertion protein
MTITEAAQQKVDQTLQGEGFLGIHLEGGGCSGYQIKLSPTTDIPQDAEMISKTIFSDPISLELLGDAEMDWIDDPFRPTFNFTPPTGASSCGCGNSFTL